MIVWAALIVAAAIAVSTYAGVSLGRRAITTTVGAMLASDVLAVEALDHAGAAIRAELEALAGQSETARAAAEIERLRAEASLEAVEAVRDRLFSSKVRELVIVTLKSQAAFRGVLYAYDERTLVLRDAEMMPGQLTAAPTLVDGEVLLARSEVDYIQRP